MSYLFVVTSNNSRRQTGAHRKGTVMITPRRSTDRGHIDHGWLDARHTFSFGDYMDPRFMAFRSLRVINEDVIAPRRGFGEHGHQDMEIITYPISGAIRHRDSLGHEEDVTSGMIQVMSAGSGIRHAESNAGDEPVHLLQIWIEPREAGLEPTHASGKVPVHDEPGRLHRLVGSDADPDALAQGLMTIAQDASMSAGVFEPGDRETVKLGIDHHGWVQVVRGSLKVIGNGTSEQLAAGDGAAISDEASIELVFETDSEIVFFDLA